MEKKINIAIDGYSGCGKSTLAKALAEALDYIYIDSGAMYRAVTFHMIKRKIDKENIAEIEEALEEIDLNFKRVGNSNHLYLNGEYLENELRTMEVNGAVSFFSTISQVRTKLVDIQKSLAKRKGFVMDGRDIGTVVLTNAELKLFLTCDLETRVMRRKKELDDKNILATFESVRENFLERDYIDSTRADSPLIRASDAILIDNSTLTQEALLSYCLELVAEKLKVY